MNHLKQVTWIAAAEKRIAELETQARANQVKFEILMNWIKELEAKRGPGRPKVERNSPRDN